MSLMMRTAGKRPKKSTRKDLLLLARLRRIGVTLNVLATTTTLESICCADIVLGCTRQVQTYPQTRGLLIVPPTAMHDYGQFRTRPQSRMPHARIVIVLMRAW